MPTEQTPDEEWYQMLTEGEPVPRRLYHLHGFLPQIRVANCVARPSKVGEDLSCT